MSTSRHLFSNVDEYIKAQPEAAKEGLKKIREAIRKAAPQAEEAISYGMPGYKFHGSLVYFAAWKNHIGLYAMPTGVAAFADRLADYKTEKAVVQFPIGKPIPIQLVTDMVKFRVKENLDRAAAKQLAKTVKKQSVKAPAKKKSTRSTLKT